MTFFYFCCSHCKTWAVALRKSGGYVRCNGCGGSKAFKYQAHGDMQDVIDACEHYGVAHLPLPQLDKLFPCDRCGEMVPNRERRSRPDGDVCRACYKAEEHPPVVLATPEEVKAHLASQKSAEREAIERQEAAYAAAEKQ